MVTYDAVDDFCSVLSEALGCSVTVSGDVTDDDALVLCIEPSGMEEYTLDEVFSRKDDVVRIGELAIEAACVIRRAAAELSDVKARLRAEAEIVSIKRGDKEQVEFESAAGTATVVFVDDVPRIPKELDPRDIKGALGPELWTTLFREEVSLAPGFSKAYEELPGKFKRIVRKYVAWEPTSARVLLPKIDKEQEEQWLKRAS